MRLLVTAICDSSIAPAQPLCVASIQQEERCEARVEGGFLGLYTAVVHFPAVRIGRHMYAEGGLFAAAPDPVALHELEHFRGVDSGRVSMLLIGQTEGQRGPAYAQGDGSALAVLH